MTTATATRSAGSQSCGRTWRVGYSAGILSGSARSSWTRWLIPAMILLSVPDDLPPDGPELRQPSDLRVELRLRVPGGQIRGPVHGEVIVGRPEELGEPPPAHVAQHVHHEQPVLRGG